MSRPRHIIIAGSNKCGTTSLFRYLGHHPEVQISSVKESLFFRNNDCEKPEDAYAEYLSLFPGLRSTSHMLVEATPQYLHSGPAVAERIHRLIPDVGLVFMLRNPTDRLRSAYMSQRGKVNWAARDTQLAEFVDLALAGKDEAEAGYLSDVQSACWHELRVGCYAENLAPWFALFADEQITVRFFDHFQSDVRRFMTELCIDTGLDPGVYKNYAFTIENMTRNHRSDRLRAIADNVNVRFEYMLNRYPSLRRAGRSFYDAINTRKSGVAVDLSELTRIDQYYAERNRELARLLSLHKPRIDLPAWLSREDESVTEDH